MLIVQELQRRLDQTLGKPGSYLTNVDRVGNVKPMTVGARMYRVEQQLNSMDRKLDQLVHAINNITIQQQRPMPLQYYHASGPLTLPPAFDHYNQQYHSIAAAGMTAQQLHGLELPAGPSQATTPVSSILQSQQNLPHLEDDV